MADGGNINKTSINSLRLVNPVADWSQGTDVAGRLLKKLLV